jgi:hypothetical protein
MKLIFVGKNVAHAQKLLLNRFYTADQTIMLISTTVFYWIFSRLYTRVFRMGKLK